MKINKTHKSDGVESKDVDFDDGAVSSPDLCVSTCFRLPVGSC